MTLYSTSFSITDKVVTTTASVVLVSSFISDPGVWFSRNYLERSKIELGFTGNVTFTLNSSSSVGSEWTYTFVLVDESSII